MAEYLQLQTYSFSSLLLASAGVLLTTVLAYGLYNVHLHPLRKYPGPRLWSAYRLPYVVSACQGTLPYKTLELHKKYGSVVRVAPDELSFIDAQAFADLQNRLADKSQLPKDLYPYGPNMGGTERQILLASDAIHARIRRIYAPAFTAKAVEETGDLLIKYANLLITALKKSIEKGNPCPDMSSFYNYVTFDLTGEFTFDEPFHCLERGGEEHMYLRLVLNGVLQGFVIKQLDRYGVWTILEPFLRKSVLKVKAQMDDYTGELIDRRLDKGFVPGKADLWNFMLKDESFALNRQELINNGNVFVVAGSDTTSTLLTGTTYWLCREPRVLARVVREVREAFRTSEEITPKAVDKLPYLIAVLSEGMRIMPPTAWGFARKVHDPAGHVVAGNHVPHNTMCAVFHWAAYHSEANFALPEEFHPERWLPDAPAEFEHDSRESLQPFHVGPRGCLGKNLAYAEMRLIMAKMLWHFDIELADPRDPWWASLKAYAVWGREPLRIRLKVVER